MAPAAACTCIALILLANSRKASFTRRTTLNHYQVNGNLPPLRAASTTILLQGLPVQIRQERILNRPEKILLAGRWIPTRPRELAEPQTRRKYL